jgi:hypothetical protein
LNNLHDEENNALLGNLHLNSSDAAGYSSKYQNGVVSSLSNSFLGNQHTIGYGSSLSAYGSSSSSLNSTLNPNASNPQQFAFVPSSFSTMSPHSGSSSQFQNDDDSKHQSTFDSHSASFTGTGFETAHAHSHSVQSSSDTDAFSQIRPSSPPAGHELDISSLAAIDSINLSSSMIS